MGTPKSTPESQSQYLIDKGYDVMGCVSWDENKPKRTKYAIRKHCCGDIKIYLYMSLTANSAISDCNRCASTKKYKQSDKTILTPEKVEKDLIGRGIKFKEIVKWNISRYKVKVKIETHCCKKDIIRGYHGLSFRDVNSYCFECNNVIRKLKANKKKIDVKINSIRSKIRHEKRLLGLLQIKLTGIFTPEKLKQKVIKRGYIFIEVVEWNENIKLIKVKIQRPCCGKIEVVKYGSMPKQRAKAWCHMCKYELRKMNSMRMYGVEHSSQRPEVMEKSMMSGTTHKPYFRVHTNEIIWLQGNESAEYYRLAKSFQDDDIVDLPKDVPEIWYNGHDNRYYIDFWVLSINLGIEVKSWWWLYRDLDINLLKRQAFLDHGHDFKYAIWEKKKNIYSHVADINGDDDVEPILRPIVESNGNVWKW